MSTFTPNLQLEQVARAADVGTWDTPTNANWTIADLTIGGIANISVNNSNVVLSAAQFQARQLNLSSTLTGNITVTFPTSFIKAYEINSQFSGSSAFTITLQTTAAGGTAICCPPGQITDVVNDGANMKYKNLPPVGTLMDLYASSMPSWITGCTIPPYLNCDGTTFSSGAYVALAALLGGNTLPDARGRTGFTLAQGTTRLTSAVTGFSPATVGAAGGDQNLAAHNHTITITDPGHNHVLNANTGGTTTGGGGFSCSANTNATINPANTGITAGSCNAGTGAAANIPPAFMTGLKLIRAG